MSDRIDSDLVNNDTMIDGASLLAACLARSGVTKVFGVVGIPITEVAIAVQHYGRSASRSSSQATNEPQDHIVFYSMRNEQTSSYAASIVSFIDSSIGCSLSVAGPGVVHSLAGIANAWANRWPLIHISAAIDQSLLNQGGFQEAPQVAMVAPYIKFHACINNLSNLPALINRAAREATSGRPGPVFIEMPANLVHAVVRKDEIQWTSRPHAVPRPLASKGLIDQSIALINQSKKPLLIIGKGAAYSRADSALRKLVSLTSIPFLPTPMGKGVVQDSHPLNVSAARSQALKEADLIIVLGARFNWMLHFGMDGRFNQSVKAIQVDIAAEELGNGHRTIDVPIQGDIQAVVEQLNEALSNHSVKLPTFSNWINQLKPFIHKNNAAMTTLTQVKTNPITYYRAFDAIRTIMSNDSIFVNEGANTMDIGRTMISHDLPRSRLDAGTFATMGLGVGYAIAAAVCHPDRRVVAVQGDSALGFSCMDFETAVRYSIPIVFIVLNNSGVYHGSDENELQSSNRDPVHLTPVTSLSHHTRYDVIATTFGSKGRGFYIDKSEQLEIVLKQAFDYKAGPSIVNIIIANQQSRKKQTHSWQEMGPKDKHSSKL